MLVLLMQMKKIQRVFTFIKLGLSPDENEASIAQLI